ncbi:metallophosphoesterase family protein [Streptomyces sp. NPDC014735]|uniref:metallophosphoesterase family protein n=1 Tax=unclassified Streptomyces TaxID=2593676 RepID=UPI003702D753
MWITLGNHDVQAGHGPAELRHLGLPSLPYTRQLPGIQLLFLNANRPDAAQARWLETRLSAPGPPVRVVVTSPLGHARCRAPRRRSMSGGSRRWNATGSPWS